MTLGEKIAVLRRENHYTQEQLADILGVTRQTVGKWESDVSYPEMNKLIELSRLFHVTLDELVKEERNLFSVEQRFLGEEKSANYSELFGYVCNIALKNWDSGYDGVKLIGQDEIYLYFCQLGRGEEIKYGIVRSCYVDTVSQAKVKGKRQEALQNMPWRPVMERFASGPFTPFLGKICHIQMHSPNLTSFLLETDGYQGVRLISAEGDTVQIQDGEEKEILRKGNIAGIMEM